MVSPLVHDAAAGKLKGNYVAVSISDTMSVSCRSGEAPLNL